MITSWPARQLDSEGLPYDIVLALGVCVCVGGGATGWECWEGGWMGEGVDEMMRTWAFRDDMWSMGDPTPCAHW